RPLEARVAIVDDDLGHRAYVLAEPLAPGDSLTLAWRVRYRARGFPNSGVPTLVVGNGTYFNNYEWMPQLGYQPQRELSNEAQRAEQGLPDRPAVPRLEDERAPFFTRHADVIDLDVVVGTDPDQVAVAPGALRRTWTEGGRRWFHYRPGAPIRNSFSILSARYDVHRARAGDVAIEVLHDPAHGRNAASFAVSMAASLEYYGARFGAYPHDHLRMVEFPGYANYLRAHPINIVFGEHFALLAPERDERDIDFPFAIVAHEVAHQWWGNALTPAHVEGGALLAESLAWYGALGVVEQRYGDAHLRRLLDMMRESYLTPRARADVPLLRASDWFVSYRKGPFAMYALREYVGEARVDAALRRFFETWAGRTDRLATSLDLYRELVAVTPDSLRPLLGDLFERNTFWSLGAVAARADSLPSGEWRVTLEFEAAKVAVDTAGVETPLPFDEPVEIGVFGVAGQGGVNGGRGEPLYRAWHPLRAGVQTVTVVVPARPGAAGVDPRLLLLDTEPFDNVIDIGADGRSAPRPLMQFSARESAARDRTALASLGR
ncbi:MAG TPA: M1 family aminopeptidase, partial [Longimicrobiales bacterium]